MSRINRLNVTYCGKRTTARFPYELFSLFTTATESEEEAISLLREHLEGEKDDMGGLYSASDSARAFMMGYTASKLRHLKIMLESRNL